MTSPFARVSRRTQIARMRRAGRAALDGYGITDPTLRVIQHDFNSTFRVDADGERHALRISMNSGRTADEVAAELAWISALTSDTDLTVAQPVQPADPDRSVVTTRVDGLDGDRPAALFRWLDGADIGDRIDERAARQIGRTAAVLHEHTRTWSPPQGISFRDMGGVLMDEPNRFEQLATLDLPAADIDLLSEAPERLERELAHVYGGSQQLLHADLHPWNVKWSGDRLAVFDFDDCGIAPPITDLSISCYYLRDRLELRSAVLDGYRDVTGTSVGDGVDFQMLIAARGVLLLNTLLGWVTAGSEDRTLRFARDTAAKLRHLEATGLFLHEPPT